MKIMSVNNERGIRPSFNRKPYVAEMPAYTKAVQDGLNVLGKKLGFIVHSQSLPAQAWENTGHGSLLSRASEYGFIPFLKSHAFTSIQHEPLNMRRSDKAESPYSPMSEGKNVYMIPLDRLASDEYKFLVDRLTVDWVINSKSDKQNSKVNYKEVRFYYDQVLQGAYNNFKNKLQNSNQLKEDEKNFIINLSNEFERFKYFKWMELEPSAIYELLAKQKNCENWKYWNEDVDKYLYSPRNYDEANKTRARFYEIKSTHNDDLNFFMFKQFLVDKEIEKMNNRNNSKITTIGDSPIAFSLSDEWAYRDSFLEGFAMGCPPDYFSKDGQRWGFGVLNPDKIFNPDGSLGDAGRLIQKKYEDIFKSSPGGVRIDHIMGLIDPFVYSINEPHMTPENSGRLYSSPNNPILKNFVKHSVDSFASVLEKIVLPAAEKYGISRDKIICEDLGEITPFAREVINKLGLTGLAVTEFDYSGFNATPDKVIMLGSHDNPSFIEYTDNLFADPNRDRFYYKTHILASDTVVPNEDVNGYREWIRNDKKRYMASAITELFTSPAKKVQVFFTDFLGMKERYNTPGENKNCWQLRIPERYEELYYENLKQGLGFNLPDAIARAIRQKGQDFINKHQELLQRLDKFTGILKQ